MKKINFLILFIFCISVNGCKKYLDVNTNPNNPTDVPESISLPAVETVIATQITGGNVTFGVAPYTSYWMQQLALNQEQPQIDGYKITTDGVDWYFFYPTLKNLQLLSAKAVTNSNYAYAGIAEVLSAYTMSIITDLWGDVPYSQALVTDNIRPAYDKQEDIYKGLQAQLDKAIEYFGKPAGLTPGSDDFIYGGDMDKWEKFAYTLKARYYMHLSKAPGYTAAAQADFALGALQNGFSSNDDDATFAYPGSAGNESPWFQNTLSGAGGVVLSSTLIDSLVSRHDPRLPVIAAEAATGGGYHGRVIGTGANPDPDEYSRVNDFYAGAAASMYILTYGEALFLKAEATLVKSGATVAQPIYQDGITAHMTKLGIDIASPAAMSYLASRGTLTAGNALQRIMEEKSIADFLSIENYNDWRRTGYPLLIRVQNSFQDTDIPLRMPYPLTSITSNPQPENEEGATPITKPVWWDN
jgi:hypothetical protein